MRSQVFAIITLSLTIAAPIKRASELNGALQNLPQNGEHPLPCSGNTCAVLTEATTHQVADFTQHLGTQEGIITTGAATGIEGGTYGAGSGVAEEVQSDGQTIDAKMNGYPTDPSTDEANRSAAPGSGRKRQSVEPITSAGQQAGSEVLEPVLDTQAGAGQTVKSTANDGNSGEGPGAVVGAGGDIAGGFTKEAHDYLGGFNNAFGYSFGKIQDDINNPS